MNNIATVLYYLIYNIISVKGLIHPLHVFLYVAETLRFSWYCYGLMFIEFITLFKLYGLNWLLLKLYSVCLFLYGPFCHSALKLAISTLFTIFFLWTSLQFLLWKQISVFFFRLLFKNVYDKYITFWRCIVNTIYPNLYYYFYFQQAH